jgi:hypothetical protein
MMTISDKKQVVVSPPLSPIELQTHVDKLRNAKPPIPGMTWEQYRDYQSWRITLQIIAYQFANYSQTAGGEKLLWKKRLQDSVTGANVQVTRFPGQGLPKDVVQPAGIDCLIQDNPTEYWLAKLLQQLEKEFADEIVLNIPKIEEI